MRKERIKKQYRDVDLRNGMVVYFVDDVVYLGVVDQPFYDLGYAYIDLLELADHRYINGVHINDFVSETEWKKLPKGWTYDTELFSVENRIPDEQFQKMKELSWTDPDDVRTALDQGILVLAKENFHGAVDAEIDRNRGFRIRKYYPHWTLTYGKPNALYRRVSFSEIFRTYQEAKERIDYLKDKTERELKMTDDEWSWNEIQRTLGKTNGQYRERCREFLEKLEDIWDVETKVVGGKVFWRRYENRTEWTRIE